jgi:hypothetical protein
MLTLVTQNHRRSLRAGRGEGLPGLPHGELSGAHPSCRPPAAPALPRAVPAFCALHVTIMRNAVIARGLFRVKNSLLNRLQPLTARGRPQVVPCDRHLDDSGQDTGGQALRGGGGGHTAIRPHPTLEGGTQCPFSSPHSRSPGESLAGPNTTAQNDSAVPRVRRARGSGRSLGATAPSSR